MGFVETAAEAALGLSLERVRQGTDASSFDPRPDFDPKQAAELRAEQADGRPNDIYHQVLAYWRFEWWPLLRLQEQLPGATLKTEGEWRNAKLKLAFTPSDLTGGFPGTPSMSGPEQFDRYVRDEILKRRVSRGLVPKSVLTESRRRRS